jgi:phenylacetate-CoA ligase
MVLALLREFKQEFEHFIIFTDPNFAKKILEDGIKIRTDWKSFNVSFVLGGYWFSNSLSNYLMNLLGTDFKNLEKGQVRITMGLSEIGLNLFNDSPVLAGLRDAVQKDEKLRKEIFGDIKTAPEIMYYYPNRTFIETINKDKNGFGELIFTNLNKEAKIPLIRYNSHDIGKLFSFDNLKQILIRKGYQGLVPEFKLPIAGILGRRKDYIIYKEEKIFPEDIKEALFRDSSIAGSITGYFRLSKKTKPMVEIQLKKGKKLTSKLSYEIQKKIYNLTSLNISVKLYEYEKFPYAMELNYEKKFKFI